MSIDRSPASPPAILLAGGMIALSAARSLKRGGVTVYGLGHRDDPLRHSRACDEFVEMDTGPGVSERFWEWLARGPHRGVILPCSDEGVEFLASRRESLVAIGYSPIEANDEAALAMLDKLRTFELATEGGIPVPSTVNVSSLDQARATAERTGYPCALKPRHSHLFAHRFGVATKAFVVSDETELDRAMRAADAWGLEMLITEIVPGPDAGFCSYYAYIDEAGQPLFEVTKRKVRQYPPKFGAGCYHLTDWNPEVAALGLRFFRSAGIRGLANVEFKRDERDGELKLIECNHRLTAATEQLRLAGADISLFTYNRTVGREGPAIGAYRLGLGHWYPLRDFRAFLAYRRSGEVEMLDWLRTLLHPQTFPVASLHDPVPSLAAAARRVRRRLGRAEAPGGEAGRGGRQPPFEGSRSTTSISARSDSRSMDVGPSPEAPSPTSSSTVR